MARFLTTAVVLSSGLAGACLDNAGPDPGRQIFQASLDLWNDEGPDSYVMVLRRQTISANPDLRVVITVENDVVVSRFYEGTNIPVSAEAAAGYPGASVWDVEANVSTGVWMMSRGMWSHWGGRPGC